MSRIANGDLRQKILDAAEHRLWHYGFKKTTIDEIAADAGVGKGTVYLHFESKEDIALAIVTRFKELSLREQQRIAQSGLLSPVEKLKQLLTQPAVAAYRRCMQSPSAREMVIAVRPHIQTRTRPYQEREISLLAAVLDEGNAGGVFAVPDVMYAARMLKTMCAGFLPPYPSVECEEDIETQIGGIVDLVFVGLCHIQGKRGIDSTSHGKEYRHAAQTE